MKVDKKVEVIIKMRNLKHLTILLVMSHAMLVFVVRTRDVMLNLAPTHEG